MSWRDRSFLVLILILAAAARAGMVVHVGRGMDRNVDDYRELARRLSEGRGFCTAAGRPTAYRPPLYPMLLAACMRLGPHWLTAAALLQLALGLLAVWLSWMAAWIWLVSGGTGPVGVRGGLPAHVAACVVALDPLLVRSTASLMTESATACFTALVLFGWFQWALPRHPEMKDRSLSDAFGLGWALGLALLCHVSSWIFLGVLAAAMALSGPFPRRRRWRDACVMLLAAFAIQTPWWVRNFVVLGGWIPTTTHGGYTLLLGNNPVFYREVVDGPRGAIWGETSLERWQAGLNRKAARMSEIERDAWFYREAWTAIRRQPGDFLRAAVLRVGWLWRPLPHLAESKRQRWAAAAIFGLESILLAAGLATPRAWRWPGLVLPGMLLSMTALHVLYWSDLRMRAPLVPAIALLTGLGCARIIERRKRPGEAAKP